MKYKLTEETKVWFGRMLHRIECVESFNSVSVGEKGGWIEDERNLSQNGNAWVYGNAKVYGNAEVRGDAHVCDNAWVYGNANVYGNTRVRGDAHVCDNARVYGNAKVYGNTRVRGDARVGGDACVYNNADYIVFKNNWSSGRYFTWTRSNDMWTVGCFHGTGKELIDKAYKDSENSGKHYEAYVNFVEKLKAME